MKKLIVLALILSSCTKPQHCKVTYQVEWGDGVTDTLVMESNNGRARVERLFGMNQLLTGDGRVIMETRFPINIIKQECDGKDSH